MNICLSTHIISFVLILSGYLTASPSFPLPQKYTEITCSIVPVIRKSSTTRHPHVPGPTPRDKDKLRAGQSSSNWSGYAAETNLNSPTNGAVSAVYGSWIVPTITRGTGNTFSSIWVGIDGFSNPTVEQIGTEHDFINGKQQHYAWFEMYPGASFLINGFLVRPGDVISASVLYSGNNVFTMTLYNNTTRVTTTIPTRYTTSAKAKRSSAEWIVEAPYLNGILPLSHFGTAYLLSCSATINGVTGPINKNTWANTAINMVTGNGTTKAATSSLSNNGSSFSVTWNHQ